MMVKHANFDDFIVGHTYCVQYSGVKTLHKITAKSEDSVSMQTVMRDGSPHPECPEPEIFSREEWSKFRWGPRFGIMYDVT